MSYVVDLSHTFKREAKRLAKRYATFTDDLEDLIDTLEVNPHQGIGLGGNCYKIRLAIRSKGKGKSGGARVITCVVAVRETVYLLSIYDKSDYESLSSDRVKDLLKELGID
ncbi:MAG: type II toxin-antitoxin system RelE/ParE family toxin [Flavobacteriales bacterium]|nr:type II toxin-antitoxin system RelE/ParE family toxin [Flavobacteriales bacterium]